MSEPLSPRLSAKVRAVRRRAGLTQAKLAADLGISPSYLAQIESGRRALTAPVLIRLAQRLGLDLGAFAAEGEARLSADLMEVFGDPLFDDEGLTQKEVQELAATTPNVARAVVLLFRRFQAARERSELLASQLAEEEGADAALRPLLPSEEVSDVLQRRDNHFPALEDAARRLFESQGLVDFNRYERLCRYLEQAHGIRVRVVSAADSGQTLRRYDPERRELTLSEVLAPRSRHFHLAHHVALLTLREELDAVADEEGLTGEPSRTLCRVALANYFAAAVLMPYEPFLEAARDARYDIEVLGNRFRTSFEQVCHRLTTLRRPGAEGVPFHLLRVDIAGNISKRFSGSGIRFARFSGVCPRWNVFRAFLTPGTISRQVSRMPDGTTYFCVARTVRTSSGGFHSPSTLYAVGLGCDVRFASGLVYADGMDVESETAAVPIGVTCRLCERTDCAQRAFPSVQRPLQVEEHARRLSFY